jgi:hypothetical protein
VELVWIPEFFKKVVSAFLGGILALVDEEDLANNISTSHWLLPISNSFHSFLQNSTSEILGYR